MTADIEEQSSVESTQEFGRPEHLVQRQEWDARSEGERKNPSAAKRSGQTRAGWFQRQGSYK